MLRRDAYFYPVCGVLVLAAVLFRGLGLPFMTHDMQDFLLPWFDTIVTHGHFAALKDGFYNYTPFYMYLLTAASYLDGVVGRVALIKSISFLFDGIAAFLIYRIALAASVERRGAILAGLVFLNLPTVILNGAFWGQCDVIYSTFLLAFAYCLIQRRPFPAMLMFSMALSIKVQAIFAAPFVVYLVLAGVVPAVYVALVPVVYAALALPVALMGRGWSSLFMIYADQAGTAHKLSARAPNFYVAIQHFVPAGLYPIATLAGVLLAGAVSLIVLRNHFRQRPPLPAIWIVAALALWLALEPSLLPKMHERYFFGADVFAFAFAVLMPRASWVALLFQAGSVLAYLFFMMINYDVGLDFHPAALLGAVAAIPATLGLGWYYWRVTSPAKVAAPA